MRQQDKTTRRVKTTAAPAVNLACASDRLTIRNNVFTEKGMISGDRAGILAPMLLNARQPGVRLFPCPFQTLFEPCDG
ncbi:MULTISPECIES: hypothetical protein [Burkholderia]|uniref:Uncharacterized protein n=1 Tax=Burkholderia theae TaxID=3143496 RepID=A0ABU9WBN7_9BURK|nr:hypothetical protein [Burkholderia stabilis]